MTLIAEQDKVEPADRLRQLLGEREVLAVPGAHDALTSLLARRRGFEALYFSGGAYSASLGIPDLSLLTLNDVASGASWVARASRLPLIVGADTGFGEALNVVRTVRDLEMAGAAAVQIEDQVSPKRCGHLDGKAVLPADAMAEKIAAAREARRKLLIIARTDARATHGLDEAVRRGNLYLEAGADVIFPEALQSPDEFEAYAKAVEAPLLANMTEFGVTPYLPLDRFGQLGYKLVIYPVTALRVAAKAIDAAFVSLARSGTQEPFLDEMLTRDELYQLIEYERYENLDRRLSRRTEE